ncbi:protein hypothetical protein [Limosa lapponica baueri]|uniref:Uncharacterized protein n=1 Tax=Limosa lapponica baueri TaxID=1758121 RepID=A0A2I0TAG7_LIMLA|nr:protein hypothetical protein [Limosa lapponica baueri]
METSICLQPPSSTSLQRLSCLRFDCRCEASIAKLSGDISIIRREAQKTDKEIYGLHSALKNCVGDFEKKLERMEKPQKYEKQLNQMKSDEKNLQARITRFERQVWKELEEIQNEYRSGFQSIHESLELLKEIQNSKLKLEKKKIQKDMKKRQ